ncbi:MAG: mechanosensitive ion channel family protein [Planctomycetota bacterium]|jgi:small conductance mechanosensitive channel
MLTKKEGFFIVFMLVAASPFIPVCFSQETEQESVAMTTSDPQIPVEDLELLLKPLTKDELTIEAEAWLLLLKNKAREISTVEIQMREKSREIEKTEEEIGEKIEEIEETEDQIEDGARTTADISEEAKQKVEVVTETAKEIQEKVEAIDQTESEIEGITAQSQIDLESKVEEDLTGAEEDLKEKTEEVIEATEKTKDTVEQIAKSDIELKEKVRQIGKAEVELQSKVREQMLVNINKLREERAGLIDRVNIVLAALKEKGGEVEEYEKYVAAVSGLGVDIKDIQDVSAFRIIVWGWLKSKEGGLRWVKNITLFFITLLVFYGLAYVAGRITRRTVSVSKKSSDLLKEFFVSVVRKTIMVIGIIVALSMLEINIGPFIAGIGVVGFILGFALQGTLSNFAAGLMILIYRPFDVGQVIEAAGVKGIVDSMNLVSTTIKTFDNQIVVVPNGSVWGGVITNVTGSDTRRVDMTFGISYGDDIAKAQHVLEDIVSKHELILRDPNPVIKLHELADSSVNFVCRPWVKTSDYWTVYWDVTRAVKERFDEEGVSIPFPQRDVHIQQATPGK